MSNSAVDPCVLWNQLPELGKDKPRFAQAAELKELKRRVTIAMRVWRGGALSYAVLMWQTWLQVRPPTSRTVPELPHV